MTFEDDSLTPNNSSDNSSSDVSMQQRYEIENRRIKVQIEAAKATICELSGEIEDLKEKNSVLKARVSSLESKLKEKNDE